MSCQTAENLGLRLLHWFLSCFDTQWATVNTEAIPWTAIEADRQSHINAELPPNLPLGDPETLSKGNIIDLADYFKGCIVNVFLLKAASPSSKDGEPENLPTKPTMNASATKLTKLTAPRSLLGGLDSSVDTLWQKITGGGNAPPLSRISNHREGGGVADGALDGTTMNGDKKEEVYDGADDDIDGTPLNKSTLDGDENSRKGGEVNGNALHDMEDNGGKKDNVRPGLRYNNQD
ncbi:hypothetical protein EV421DRAFT_1903415 [Armillaria borealis]|uniref:Uncharacterized protein n=1 Tax=Armillaria borealis TaxID=47425 RepID=A0AA39JJB3_9AGAR|nr:hypothetical protein EV421DRAFT_1903415 [Armillaria borealis]